MQDTLNKPEEMNFRIFEIPLSGIRLNGEKIRYFDFISSLKNKDCNEALERILPNIDMKSISEMICAIPCISDLQKTFYTTMLRERKEKILDKSLQLLQSRRTVDPAWK